MLADAKPMEYSAHLIPEGGYYSLPPLYTDGFMLAGDAAQMINPKHREGSNLAMAAGMLAAQTAVEAKKKGDFSRSTLSAYQKRLEASVVLPDLKDHRDIEPVIERNMHLLTLYPELANKALHEYFTVDGRPKRLVMHSIKKKIFKARPMLKIAKDFWTLRKAFS
jgi:electron transfer flavoprotein-quinone oxidoreductase